MIEHTPEQIERFLSHVQKTDTCWLWTASLTRMGYANWGARVNGKSMMIPGSRFAFEAFVDPIPEGLCVLHACDNRRCVNPAHLFLGTKRDNSDDMIKKGRAVHNGIPGPLNANAKLSWKQARQIRHLYGTGDFSQRFLANLYHLSLSTVQDVINNKSYTE